jgi:large subunit ribosomal protein L19
MTTKKEGSLNLIEHVEQKYRKSHTIKGSTNNQIQIGDLVRIGYNIPEGEKERIQSYEGLIISISNRGLGKSFTLRRTVQGIGIEQVFVAHSPKIVSIYKKQSSKVRRANLYFIRFLSGKSTRLKRKF